MNTYLLIEGASADVKDFEMKVSDALNLGYILAGELQSHFDNKINQVLFYQPMILDLEDDESLDDLEESE